MILLCRFGICGLFGLIMVVLVIWCWVVLGFDGEELLTILILWFDCLGLIFEFGVVSV